LIIQIDALTFDTIIGILDFERIKKQKVLVTCIIEYTYTDSFINYAEVAECITTTTQEKEFLLLEDALLHVSRLLKSTFPLIEKLTLTYSKPDIMDNCIVSLSESWQY